MFLVSSSAGLGVPLDLFELLVEAVASSVPCLAEENERVGDDVMSKRKVVGLSLDSYLVESSRTGPS